MELVAQLTYDHLDRRKGNVPFSYGGFLRFWQNQFYSDADLELARDILELPNTEFRLYDDDNFLCYSGWLRNDVNCMVQQFVLAWAMADSGCTIIKVKVNDEWVQEIA